jgi:hypothetical protein
MKQLYPRQFATVLKNVLVLSAMFSFMSVSAQSLNFSKYELVKGGEGQKGAEYRFSGVVNDAVGNPTVDCIVRIDDMSSGVILKSIDNQNSSDLAAFQPVVEHVNTIGPSWIEFSFSFVPHAGVKNADGMFQLPLLAASIYGLSGFDRAQEFVECDLGNNSQVIYETEINNLMVTRMGTAFRAENKWGVQTDKIPAAAMNERFALLNQQVSGLKVKFGINRKAQTWAGTCLYNLSLSSTAPDLAAVYKPTVISFDAKVQQNYVSVEWNTAKTDAIKDVIIEKSTDGETFQAIGKIDMQTVKNANGSFSYADQAVAAAQNQSFYRLHMIKENGEEEYSAIRKVELTTLANQVAIKLVNSPVAGKMAVAIPAAWSNKKVSFEIYNDQAELLRKVIEPKAPANVKLNMQDLPAGTYVIRAYCGKEFAVEYAINSKQG